MKAPSLEELKRLTTTRHFTAKDEMMWLGSIDDEPACAV